MRRPGRGWPTLVLAALLHLIAVAPAAAQPTPPNVAFLEGTEVFRRILFERRFSPLNTFDDLAKDPAHSILIVFGDGRPLMDVRGGLAQFLAKGGVLFLATDKAPPDAAQEALRRTIGLSVSGKTVKCPNKQSCYKGLDFCPFLKPVDRASPNLFRGLTINETSLSNVASNAPSYLERTAIWWGSRELASLPKGCVLEGTNAALSRAPLFAVGVDVGSGRALVLADHSIFINEMMLPEDNGNVEFTYNCLDWLRGDAKDGRDKVL